MEISDIKRLAEAFERSDWDEVHLVVDGVEIHLSTEAGSAPQTVLATPSLAARPPARAAAPAAVPSSAPPKHAEDPHGPPGTHPPAIATAAGEGGASNAHAPVPEGYPVRSPSPGIFWRSPSPGAPPFVEVGQRVEPDTTLCIVEIMKLMNRISAGVTGTVTAVLIDNAGNVERDQPLVLIAED